LRMGTVPPDCLFFKGERGFEMAPHGSKVIPASKRTLCRCDGNCANCSCPTKRDRRN
jgi:hypothetical protein